MCWPFSTEPRGMIRDKTKEKHCPHSFSIATYGLAIQRKMRLTIVFIPVATLAAVTLAQSIDYLLLQIPLCADVCLSNAIAASSCAKYDYVCQCGPATTKIENAAMACLKRSCTNAEIQSTNTLIPPGLIGCVQRIKLTGY
jgi:hypothetical protein